MTELTGHKSDSLKKEKYSRTSNEMDNGVILMLEQILEKLENQPYRSTDCQALASFFEMRYQLQIVQSWSYYAQTNSHAKLSKVTWQLIKILRVCYSVSSLTEFGRELILKILTDHCNVFYRALGTFRNQVAIPAINLMSLIIKYDSYSLIEDFLTHFDLSISVIPRVLTPTKSEINQDDKRNKFQLRTTFINFWLDLIQATPALARKDLLLNNFKIMSAWFKLIDKVDSSETIQRMVNVLSESVLKERYFKRMTKTKILNELYISKLVPLLYSHDKSLVRLVTTFLYTYSSDEQHSIAFNSDLVWYTISPISGSNTGAPIKVNQTEYKIHNKLLFNFLKMLKPWDDDNQMNIVLATLKHVPELVMPYCAYLSTIGNHDPTMSSFWFGSTLLLCRIMRLPIPDIILNAEFDNAPNANDIFCSVIPKPITKNSLTASLHHKTSIIRQMACQMIVLAFKKYEDVIGVLDSRGWGSSKIEFSRIMRSVIPEISSVTFILEDLHTNQTKNKILTLGATTVLKYYSKHFSSFYTVRLPSSNLFKDLMQSQDLDGIDFEIMNNFLQFQELSGSHSKWWNFSANENSLFTILLRLAFSSQTSKYLISNISLLLENLLRGTIIFNELSASPVMAMINSLQTVSSDISPDVLSRLLGLIDQTILHSIKLPYKYADNAMNFHDISPFFCALLEQWHFLDSTQDNRTIVAWITIFARNMIILGESNVGMQNILFQHLSNAKEFIQSCLTFEVNERGNNEFGNYLTSDRMAHDVFFNFITTKPIMDLARSSRIPETAFDVAGSIFRIKLSIMQDNVIANSEFRFFVNKIIYSAIRIINEELFLRNMVFMLQPILQDISTMTPTTTKKALIVLNSVLKDCEDQGYVNSGVSTHISAWIKELRKIDLTNDSEWESFITNSIMCLSDEDLIELLRKYANPSESNIEMALEKILHSKDNTKLPFDILLKVLPSSSMRASRIIGDLLRNNQISDFDTESFSYTISAHKSKNDILDGYLNSHYIRSDQLLDFYSGLELIDYKAQTAMKMLNYGISLPDSETDSLIGFALEALADQNGIKVEILLEFFTAYQRFINLEQNTAIFCLATNITSQQFTHAVASYILSMVQNIGIIDGVVKWLNKCILYVTKIFSNRTKLTLKYQKLILELKNIVGYIDLWKLASFGLVEAQLEVVLSSHWVKNSSVLDYLCAILASSQRSLLNTSRLFQLILNNRENCLKLTGTDVYSKFFTSVIMKQLFIINKTAISNDPTFRVLLTLYQGTMQPHDKIILSIIESMEIELSVSWTNFIFTWDFIEEEDCTDFEVSSGTKLIVDKPEGLIVTLRKYHIEQTIKNYPVEYEAFETVGMPTFDEWIEYYRRFEATNLTDAMSIYDPYFVILLFIHNNELVKFVNNNGKKFCEFNFKKIISSKLLQLMISSLSESSNVSRVSLEIMIDMLNSAENSEFKDFKIFFILLRKIVVTSKYIIEGKIKICPIIWISIANLCDILLQPSSALYEKAYKWVLNGPLIRQNELPLYRDIAIASKGEPEYEIYYTQLSWVLSNIESGLKTGDDLSFLRLTGKLEWLADLLNNPFVNCKLSSKIYKIHYKLQRIPFGCSTLISRYAFMSNLELHDISNSDKIMDAERKLAQNSKVSNNLRGFLELKEKKINTMELIKGCSTVIKSQKRLLDWTARDEENILKRICI